jgi:hypothetical protein
MRCMPAFDSEPSWLRPGSMGRQVDRDFAAELLREANCHWCNILRCFRAVVPIIRPTTDTSHRCKVAVHCLVCHKLPRQGADKLPVILKVADKHPLILVAQAYHVARNVDRVSTTLPSTCETACYPGEDLQMRSHLVKSKGSPLACNVSPSYTHLSSLSEVPLLRWFI